MSAGVTVRGLARGARPLRVRIEPAAEIDPERLAAVDRAWGEMTRENPRLYDGPILAVESASAQTGLVACRRSSFKHLAVASRPGLGLGGVRQLGVRGVVTGFVSRRTEAVLLGRRSSRTRIYGGMWEHAPCGGMRPPRNGVQEIGEAELVAALTEEGAEEVGIDLSAAEIEPVAIQTDEAACSEDVILRVRMPGTLNPVLPCASHGGRWEYIDAAWVPVPGLAAFDRDHGASIAPPARAVFRWLGWV